MHVPANHSVSRRGLSAAAGSHSCGLRLASQVALGAEFSAQLLPFRKLLRRQDRFDPGHEVLADLDELRALLSLCHAGLRLQALQLLGFLAEDGLQLLFLLIGQLQLRRKLLDVFFGRRTLSARGFGELRALSRHGPAYEQATQHHRGHQTDF
jgi:hypothetical protein